MQPDHRSLCLAVGVTKPLIGFYDTPDPEPFGPFVDLKQCLFTHYEDWLQGRSVRLTRDSYGCPGAGRWICGLETRDRESFVKFLAETEGLRASTALMERWLDVRRPYEMVHDTVVVGPLRDFQYENLRTVTFWVDPDKLSALATGAQYETTPEDPPPVLAPFGAGCMQLAPLFRDLDEPQAIIGATDIAMRQNLPPDILAFTVTRPMFERLCALDERSFLHKPFLKRLQKSRTRLPADASNEEMP